MFPTMVTVLSAISSSYASALRFRFGFADSCGSRRRSRPGEFAVDVLGDPQDLVAEHFVCKGELPVELVHRRGLGLRLEDDVIALPAVLELVGEPPLSPEVDGAEFGASLLDQLLVAGRERPDDPLFNF